LFEPFASKINLDCQKTWDLICKGNTIGCFQIDSQLGQLTCKSIKPRNINELADIIALMRPACLEGILKDGRNIIEHYIDRKQKKEESIPLHKSLTEIMGSTQNLLLYQEQAMQIAQKLAGMSLVDTDTYIRKMLGKKKSELVDESRKIFMEGCKKENIVDEKTAEYIFDIIKKGQRYSFNRSHSISYAYNSYITAYAKTHFPHEFFVAYLNHSIDKQHPYEEINRLVNNAKEMDIYIESPNILYGNNKFELNVNNNILFGLSYIKGIGNNSIRDLKKVSNKYNLNKLSWVQLMFLILDHVNKTVAKALIGSGALDFTDIPRKKMLFDHEYSIKLTLKEKEKINQLNLENFLDFTSLIKYAIQQGTGKNAIIANKTRLNIIKGIYYSLKNPPYSLEDDSEYFV
jgi:DNA polymerase-3 subunit alpha